MPSRLAAVATLIALLAMGAGRAAADPEHPESSSAEPMLRTERQMSDLTPDALPTNYSPYHSMRAEALVSALEFFGEGVGFAVGARSSLIEIEGGAAWRVFDSLKLTASYRVLDVDLGADAFAAGVQRPGLASGMSFRAPFLGVALDF